MPARNDPSTVGMHRALALAALLVVVLSACVSTHVERRDWSHYTGPGAEHFQKEEFPFPHIDDPIEPINRISAWVNHSFLRFVLAPLATVYRAIIPETVRTHIALAGENLRFPTRVINNLLQGKWHESAVETSRFAVNTTVGVLGLFDPATTMGLHPFPEDFGQTFANWGWKNSLYVYLPLLGPSTLRDALGEIPTSYTDPTTYWPDPEHRQVSGSLPSRVNSTA